MSNDRLKCRLIGLLSALLLCAMPAQAQDSKVSKEREALRRVQSALKSAQEQQGSLQADKARLEQEKEKLARELAAARGQAGGEAARLKASGLQLAQQQVELQALMQAKQTLEAAQQERERELQTQMQAARRESAERLRAAQGLSQLLERSTTALADAEGKNGQLYALGLDLVKLYLSRTPAEITNLSDPLFGLTAVRLENQAEGLRAKLAEQRVQ